MGRRYAVDRYAEPGPRDGAGADCRPVRHSAGRTSISAARSSAAALAPRASSPGRRCSASWRRGWSASRSSSCCGVSRCTARWAIARRPARRCASAPTATDLLTAIDHHAKTVSSSFDDFFEPAADASHTLYASPAIATSHEAVRIDTGTPLFMRAPGEATGSIALESAIDETAWACGMDPLAFRLKNYAEVEPISGKPFSSKACANATRKAPNASAGRSARWRRGRCATRPACWSAGAWAPRPFRR